MSKICFVSAADRDAFRELVETRTSTAEGVRNLEAALDLVDVDSHGDTKRDGRINSSEWKLFHDTVQKYMRNYSGPRYEFGKLEPWIRAAVEHQTEVWRAGAEAAVCTKKGCRC